MDDSLIGTGFFANYALQAILTVAGWLRLVLIRLRRTVAVAALAFREAGRLRLNARGKDTFLRFGMRDRQAQFCYHWFCLCEQHEA